MSAAEVGAAMEKPSSRLWWLPATVWSGSWFGFSYLETVFFPGMTGLFGAVVGLFVGGIAGVYIEHYINRKNSN